MKARLESANWPTPVDCHLVDVISSRSLSREMARQLDLVHESPQIILISGGEVIWDEDHLDIRPQEVWAAWQDYGASLPPDP